MSENPELDAENTEEENGGQKNDAMAAFSTQMKELEDALDLLYIKANASGRNKFREEWPFVAQYIFGDTLIDYDNHGVKDHDLRDELEEKAIERRLLIKTTMSEMIDKSVDSGMLQFDYVGKVIDNFGAEMSKYLYAEDIIERVRPGLISKTKTTEPSSNIASEPASAEPPPNAQDEQENIIRAQEKAILERSIDTDDTFEAIEPIKTDTPINDLPNQEPPQHPDAHDEQGPQEPQSTSLTPEKTPHISSTKEENSDFSIPESLHLSETPDQTVKKDKTTDPNPENNDIEPQKTQPQENQQTQIHIPETLSEETKETASMSQIDSQEDSPPHTPKVDKGHYTSIFNSLAEKKAA